MPTTFPDLVRAREKPAVRNQPEPCIYFPEDAIQAEVDLFQYEPQEAACLPLTELDADFFLDRGWRHFGHVFFRNACPGCLRCRPLRIPVASFRPSRSQRRVEKRGSFLTSRFMEPAIFLEKCFQEALNLHNAFLRHRFGKPAITPLDFLLEFFHSPLPGLVHALYTSGGKLAGCGWLDIGKDSISTIYFSFHPEHERRSPGTLSMLREILWAREHGFRYYHLGYWIENHPDMHYKAALQPNEIYSFGTGTWSPCAVENRNRKTGHSLTGLPPS